MSSLNRTLCLGMMAALVCISTASHAGYGITNRSEPKNATTIKAEPPSVEALQEREKSEPIIGKARSDKNGKKDNLEDVVEEEQDLALKIRQEALREAALSYGARGGLAWRTQKIMEELKSSEVALDKTYDFRRLLVPAPSNMYIEPPIISEALNNFIVSPDGNEAAVSDAMYQITRQARIVSTPRNWRQYLERDWEEVLPPPDLLLPENAKERAAWRLWVARGWEEGIKQADEIFQSDLNRLVADFEGMVRYRLLLSQNKVSAPYAVMEDRGISSTETEEVIGNKPVKITNELRVGDRAIRISGPAELRPEGESWNPPIQTAP